MQRIALRSFVLFITTLALLGAVFAIMTIPVLAQDSDQQDLIEEEELETVQEEEEDAAEPSAAEAAFTEASPFDNLAVVLLIDVSGSMTYTDPLRLRESSAGMFIDLLGAEDYLSVITFDHEAELVTPLQPAGGPADKAALMERLSPRLEPRGDTDFVAALQLAREQFANTDTGDKVPVIMLLTDGEPDPFPGSLDDEAFMASYMALLWEEVQLVADEDILIYTVGFSDEIDPEVTRRIATDTRGQYYILQEPGELLVSFYRALESLKDRRSFLDERVTLGEGGTHTFSFGVEEYIRQANVVLVGEAGEDGEDGISVSVKPPRGSAEGIGQLQVGGSESYTSVILSRPQEEHFGTWDVTVSGSGTVTALGNADFYLEAALIAPNPGASHPLNESMDIQVEVITREKYGDEVFGMDLQVEVPEADRPVDVPLTREGNSFLGVFEGTDQQGEYQLSWQLTRDGETIYSSSAVVMVQPLPAIHTDFYFDEEGFRLGEEMVISASLNAGGRRLQESPSLQVDSFSMDLEYRDGARVEVMLHDDGNREHGNSRAGDGIWSNRLLFDREGSARALLTVEGIYRDAEFVLTRSYSFSVSEPGSLNVRLLPDDLWARAGSSVKVPLQFESSSPFTQVVRVSSPNEEVELLRDRATVPPGETVTVMFEVALDDGVEPGRIYITKEFAAEDGMTPVQPEIIDYEVKILTAWEAFQMRYADLGVGLVLVGGSAIFLGLFVVSGGSFLNRFYLKPRLKVNGSLHYKADSDNPGHGVEQQINMGETGKPEVVISFDPDNREADYIIPGSESSHDLIIANRWRENLPRFIRGWQALLRRRPVINTTVKCTPPGVLSIGGKAYSSKDLHPGDQFESGGITFNYRVDSERAAAQRGRGVDILNGKM